MLTFYKLLHINILYIWFKSLKQLANSKSRHAQSACKDKNTKSLPFASCGGVEPRLFKKPNHCNTSFLPQPGLTYTPPNPQTHLMETRKYVKEKAFEIATTTKEPLTSHAHHVKM
jgi:hypothetical protein